MTAAQFAEFFKRQGHRVIATETCCWHAYRPCVFTSLPYHRPLALSSGEVVRALLKGPAAAVRFPTHLGVGGSRQRGIFLCSDRSYDLPSLHHKMRSCTRRGLENCTIEPVEFGYLAQHGHQLNLESFDRQDRDATAMTESQWRRYCEAAGGTTGFEAWGAWVRGQLAAFLVTALVEECSYIDYQSSRTEYLPFFPNHALTFTVTRSLLTRPEVKAVTYGGESLVTTGIDAYKSRMGFECRPFGECVAVNPLLRPILCLGGQRIIRWAARAYPESQIWQRASLVLPRMGP